MNLINQKHKSYGIYISSDDATAYDYCFDYCFINNGVTKLPLGEILFNIIESIDILSLYVQEQISGTEYDNYFAMKQYNIKSIIASCNNDVSEIKRLERIRDYIYLCSQNEDMCSLAYLTSLSLAVFHKKKFFEYNYDKFYIPKRTINSAEPLPLMNNENIYEAYGYLKNKYVRCSLYSNTYFDKLSQLCFISLYELFELGYKIKECPQCKHYFAKSPKAKSDYCNRKSAENDYKGCRNYQAFLNCKKNQSKDITKLYKKVYGRLLSRTKSNSINAAYIFSEFKDGWSKLKYINDKQEKVRKQYEYLQDERWL